MRRLHFSPNHVHALCKWSEALGNDTVTLVGDEGVYFMAKCDKDEQPLRDDGSISVAYAVDCDPRGDFDTWWEAKRETYGGDDGFDSLPIDIIMKPCKWATLKRLHLFVDFDDDSFAFGVSKLPYDAHEYYSRPGNQQPANLKEHVEATIKSSPQPS